MIQDIVQVAEEKQIDKQGKPRVFIQNWLRDLVDIGYEARDVLDDFITFSSCVITAEEASNPVNFISSFMLSYVGGSSSDTSKLPLTVLNRLEKDIRSVTERFDVEIKESEKFNTLRSVVVVVGGGGSESVSVDRRPIVGPSINKQRDGLFLGRKEVKQKIMEKILHPSDDHAHVVLIWGMGGIGKTTLAQSIYNDERVKKVPRISWLCVGESKFCAEKVIREIVNDKKPIGIVNLQKTLQKELSGDRFLIVLDDVWDVDGTEWDLLFNPLTELENGGLIIITRRERQLCTAITIQMAYNLEPLSEEDSWSIFESCAYVNGKADSTPDLKGIGEKIVKKLNGHPLALKVVGRSLLDKDSSTWTKFLESKFTKDNEVMSALRWSYNHLPPHLKACFTYCSLFHKDHVLDKNVLVEMWMAHDLIQKEEQERPEDVGAQYFKELVNASLLQSRDDGKYVMHDLIHDLALLVSNGEFATANSSLSIDQTEKVRHITLTTGDYSKIPRLCKIEKLLTLNTTGADNFTPGKFEYSVLHDVFKQLKIIRVLVLSSEWIYKIPDSISELRYLRYLDVRETKVKSLPDSLCRLYNLQMLAVPFGVELPIDIVNFSSLRYVRARLSTCKGVGKLTSLQELSSIRVCQGDNIRELGVMQILRGKLSIEVLGNVSTLEGDGGALMEKQTLMDELELTFHQQLEKSTIYEEVLDALGCPPNLTYLQIDGYTGLKPPSWMVDGKHKFHKLQTLRLYNCPKLESLPPLGELIFLKHIFLRNVGVKRLGEEFYGKFTYDKVFFPSLEWLQFGDMKGWEEWNDIIIENSSVSFFPLLTILEVDECPKLVSLLPVVKNCTSKRKMNAANFMTSLSNLKISECDGLKRLQLDAFVSLKDLAISSCKSLVQITSVICERLQISSCRLLEKMDVARCDTLQVVIKILKLEDCESFRSLSIDIPGLDSLEDLRINGCQTQELAFEDGSSSSSSSGNSVAVPIHNIFTDNTQVFRTLLHHEIVSLESLFITNLEGFENFDETEANNFCKSRSLKSLYISHCKDLKSLPADFHMLSSLEELSIDSCPQLQSLPLDFHKLSSLKRLFINDCPQLQSLPPDFHKLSSLKSLSINHCPQLQSLPPDFHKLSSLEELFISGCLQLQSLPPDFHKLSSLKKLYIDHCPQLQSLPADGLPPSLSDLSIRYCPLLYERCKDEYGLDCPQLQSLPPDFHKLSSLSRLKIQNCNGLKRLQLDALVSLKDLNIWRCESLVQMTSAICESLVISSCRLLEKMDVARCDSLQIVIKILMLEDCESLRSLNINIHGMNSLEDLDITDCPTLELAFEDGSSSSSSSGNLVAVPIHNIYTNNTQAFRTLLHHELVSLESLDITELKGFENFDETESNNFCKSRSLKSLVIRQCEDLKSLPADFHKLSSLEELRINHCPKLQSLPPDFHKLSSLKGLFINDCPQLQSLPPDFHKLSSLKDLLIDCPQLQSDFHKLSSLKKLYIDHCPQLQSLPPDFHKLSSLEELSIISCPQLQSLPPDFHKLSSLKKLYIDHCPQLQSLPPDFHKLSSLKKLYIDHCPQLQSLPPDFHKLSSLEILDIEDCPQLQSLPPDFHKLSSLEELSIISCPQLQSLPADGLPPSLSDLSIRYSPLLYERCKDEYGLDWHKIKHIPCKEIISEIGKDEFGSDSYSSG